MFSFFLNCKRYKIYPSAPGHTNRQTSRYSSAIRPTPSHRTAFRHHDTALGARHANASHRNQRQTDAFFGTPLHPPFPPPPQHHYSAKATASWTTTRQSVIRVYKKKDKSEGRDAEKVKAATTFFFFFLCMSFTKPLKTHSTSKIGIFAEKCTNYSVIKLNKRRKKAWRLCGDMGVGCGWGWHCVTSFLYTLILIHIYTYLNICGWVRSILAAGVRGYFCVFRDEGIIIWEWRSSRVGGMEWDL